MWVPGFQAKLRPLKRCTTKQITTIINKMWINPPATWKAKNPSSLKASSPDDCNRTRSRLLLWRLRSAGYSTLCHVLRCTCKLGAAHFFCSRSAMVIPSYSTQWMGLLPPARRKMIEHLLHVLIESLDVFVGLVGEGFTGRSPPNQLLTVRVEQIDNQGAHRVVGNCGRDISESPQRQPPPKPL